MEILSDATFKGNVSINGGDFSVFYKGWENTPLIKTIKYGASNTHGLKFHASEFTIVAGPGFSVTDDNSNPLIITDASEASINSANRYALMVNGSEFIRDDLIVKGEIHTPSSINIWSGGYLSLRDQEINSWSCLNSILSFAKLSTFTSPSIPANCKAFEFTGTAISDTKKTHMIQVQNTSTGKSVIAETWMTANKKPAMSFAGCTSTVAAGTYTAMVI